MNNFVRVAKSVVSNPAFESKDISGDGKPETFCNWGLRMIANGVFDYKNFDGLNANQVYDFVSKNWKKVDRITAHQMSASKMVIAAQKGVAHGHVAFVVPEPMVMSAKWKCQVPQVANVGAKNGFMGVNFAFGTEPEYFAEP